MKFIKTIMCVILHGQLISLPKKMIISVPVTDLRELPQKNSAQLPACNTDNPLQITQLLMGEHIIAHEEYIDAHNVKWLRINALQQEFYYEPLEWHGFPGWIQADHAVPTEQYPTCNLVVTSYVASLYDQNNQKICSLSIGTRLLGQQLTNTSWQIRLPNCTAGYINNDDVYYFDQSIQESAQELQHSIVKTAQKFVGSWYSWGGRSAQYKDFSISSVDCSALVNLSFMTKGLQLPRMSHEQFLRAQPIECCKDLQPGDLIFFSTIIKNSLRMDHVMMYIGNDTLIEATYAGNHQARIVSFSHRMGQACYTIKNGDTVYDYQTNNTFQVFFGTFLGNPELLQSLRNDSLKSEYFPTYMFKRNFSKDLNYCRYH